MNLYEKVLDLIFPPTCEICGKVGRYICSNCYPKIKKYEIINLGNEDLVFAYQYKDIIRDLLIDYKFNDKAYLKNIFAEMIIKNKKVCSIFKRCDIIIPVPLHKKRQLDRGYNQSLLILKELAKRMELNVQDKVLKKIKNIKPQSEKRKKERIKDIKGVYIVKNKMNIIGKNILLFDDIYTTGSTTGECKKMLLKAGAKKVVIVTLARD